MTDEAKKMVVRPSQEEVSYTVISPQTGVNQCANCRWFAAQGDYGPYCAIIENYPLDILATGYCERHEVVPSVELEPEPLPVVVVEEVERSIDIELPPKEVMLSASELASEFPSTTFTLPADKTREVSEPDQVNRAVDARIATLLGGRTASEPEPEVVKYIAPDSNAAGFLKQLRGKLKRGLKPGETVLKDAHGRRYMLVVTSNSYLDREDETISTEALKSWVDRQWIADDAFHTENPLIIWHDERLKIGDIIWADMRGPFLVELAREADNPVARKAFDYREAHPGEEWGASHKFAFLPSQRDDEGTYHNRIYKRETTILPRDVAANSLTLSRIIPMPSKRDEYLNKLLGDGAAEKLDEGIDALVEFLSAQGVEHKAKGEADSQETAKEAVANADKAFKLLMPELIESQAALMERQDDLETANKALTDENATLKTKTTDELKALAGTVAQLQTQLDGRPRRASRDAETEIEKDKLPEAAQQAIADSLTEFDPFLGATVKKEL